MVTEDINKPAGRREINVDPVKGAVAADALDFAMWMFPDGKRVGQHWHVGSVSGELGQSLAVNLAGEFAGGYRDWATGEGGDCIALVMAVRNVSFEGAVDLLSERYSLTRDSANETNSSQSERKPGSAKQHTKSDKKRSVAMPKLDVGSAADLKSLAELRNLGADALALAGERGLLRFFNLRDDRAWLITDSARHNAQARRLDGQPWSWNGKKAWTLGGSRASWPIGLPESAPFQNIAVCEGEPDFLAAFHHALASGVEGLIAPVCLTGASLSIPDECLTAFTGKRVRIFVHDDQAGLTAARRWARQLQGVADEVDGFTFDGLTRTDGQPVKDLCDLASIDADAWETHRDVIENCMAFAARRAE